MQARQDTKETEWLLEMTYEHDFIKSVVGWVPLTAVNVIGQIERFAANEYLKGVRHVLQDEADEYYMLRDDFNEGVKQLKYFELVYDILIFERHLPQTIKFVDRHPQQLFVLDHIAKPLIKDNIFSPWRKNIVELARREMSIVRFQEW